MEKQPPIYHSSLNLAGLVYAVTRHFPRKAGFEEGEEMRKAATVLVKECLLANRSQSGTSQRLHHQENMSDCLALLEALIAIVNSQKYCYMAKGVQKWRKLISEKEEVKLNCSISSLGRQLYGWKRINVRQ